jgi:hypothetical protein
MGALFCAFCSIDEYANHLFIIFSFMFDFWCTFNECNIKHVSLNLSLVSALWDSTLQLIDLY